HPNTDLQHAVGPRGCAFHLLTGVQREFKLGFPIFTQFLT
ncbi:MAG: hypothetical protein ACI96P_002319, partial [Candidatus Azotimanducaceae bacterium]